MLAKGHVLCHASNLYYYTTVLESEECGHMREDTPFSEDCSQIFRYLIMNVKYGSLEVSGPVKLKKSPTKTIKITEKKKNHQEIKKS